MIKQQAKKKRKRKEIKKRWKGQPIEYANQTWILSKFKRDEKRENQKLNNLENNCTTHYHLLLCILDDEMYLPPTTNENACLSSNTSCASSNVPKNSQCTSFRIRSDSDGRNKVFVDLVVLNTMPWFQIDSCNAAIYILGGQSSGMTTCVV